MSTDFKHLSQLPGCLSPHIHHRCYEAWNETGRQGWARQPRVLSLSCFHCVIKYEMRNLGTTVLKRLLLFFYHLCFGLTDTRESSCVHFLVNLCGLPALSVGSPKVNFMYIHLIIARRHCVFNSDPKLPLEYFRRNIFPLPQEHKTTCIFYIGLKYSWSSLNIYFHLHTSFLSQI